jgi:hypothetical protein
MGTGQWKAKQHDASQPPSASIRSVNDRMYRPTVLKRDGMEWDPFIFFVLLQPAYVDTLGKKLV